MLSMERRGKEWGGKMVEIINMEEKASKDSLMTIRQRKIFENQNKENNTKE